MPSFRSRSAWRNSRLRCDCGGYHFPHRKGGGACDFGIRRDYYLGLRGGLSKPEAMTLLWAHTLDTLP